MTISLAHKFGTGISPQQFIDQMEKNKDTFLAWYNSFAWASEDDRQFFASLSGSTNLRCLLLAADWCGDVVRNVPALFHMLESAGIPIEVLVMEQHLETMDQFLTMGGRSIPVLIVTDEAGHVKGTWGPRPQYIQEAMVAFKQNNPDREASDYQTNLAETRKEIIARYGEGPQYQAAIATELRALLSGLV